MNVLFMMRLAPIPSTGGLERVAYTLKKELNSQPGGGMKVFSCSFDSGSEIENHFYIDWEHYPEELQKLIEELEISVLVIHESIASVLIRMIKPLKNMRIPNLKIIIEHHHHIAGFKYILDLAVHSIENSKGIKKYIKTVLFPIYIIYAFIRLAIPIIYAHYLAAKYSARYVLLSEYFVRQLRKKFWIKKSWYPKIISVSNPHNFLTPQFEKYKKEKTVLFVGRIHYFDKNLKELLAIWKKINTDWTLTIVGDGPDMPRLKKDIKRMKLTNVNIEGHKTNVQDYYKKSPFLFLTSVEGWGMVLIEAMEFGCIPVAYNSFAAVHEIIKDNETGFLIPAGKTARFAEKARQLLAMDPSQLDGIRRNAYDHIQQFSAGKIADKWISLFREVAQ